MQHTKILAWIHLATAGLLLCLGLALLAGLALDRTQSADTLPFAIGLFCWLAIVLLLPSLVGGAGLLRNKGWARIVIIVVSIEFLFAFPVGTALGVYGLWTLFSRGAAAAPVTAPTSWSEPGRPGGFGKRRNDVLLAMVSVGAAFVLVLGLGLVLTRGPASAIPLNGAFGVVAALALVVTALLIARLFRIPVVQFRASSKASSVPRRENIPAVPRIPPVSDGQKENGQDPTRNLTCPHLEPFERAMRAAGIAVRPVAQPVVQAVCRVYRPGLIGPFTLHEPVSYAEYWEAERSPEDFPRAHLRCSQCGARVDVVHPAEYHLTTPWFPGPPRPLTLVAERPFAPGSSVTAIASSPSGRLAAVAAGVHDAQQEVVVWDTAECQPVRLLPPHGVIRSMAWSRDEKILVTGRGVLWTGGPGSHGESIFVWDTATGTELLRFGSDLFGVRGMALSDDGRLLLVSGMLGKTCAEGSSLDLWEVASGRLVARLARVDAHGHEMLPFFTAVAFTPDGATAFAGSDLYRLPPNLRQRSGRELPAWWNRGIRAWRVSDGQELDLIRQQTPVRALAISRDGSRLFAAGLRSEMWSLPNGALLWNQANGYDNVTAASPDCRLVARGTGYRLDNHGLFVDTAVELYDGTSGAFLSLARHRTTPEAMAFTSDGRSLLAGGLEGELNFWHWGEDVSS